MPSMWDGIEPEGHDDYGTWDDVEPTYQNTPTVVKTYYPSNWGGIDETVEPLGQQTVLRQGAPDQPSLIERGATFVQDLLGVKPESRPNLAPRTTSREAAQATVEMTGGPSESAMKSGLIEQGVSNYFAGAFPGFQSLYEAVEGEKFLKEPDTTVEELAAGAGRFAGIITGLPGKLSHSAMAGIAKKFPQIAAYANQGFFGRILRSVLNEGASVGTMTALSSVDEALKQPDIESAAKTVLNGFKEGAKLGAVFGLARGVFPNQNTLSRMARIASGLAGIEALHSGQGEGLQKENKIMEWVHRFMDVYFLWKGLGVDYGTKALEELENTKDTGKRYDMIKEVELYNYKKEHNRLPPKAQVASARDMLDQIEEANQRRANLEQGFSPWSPELAEALDSEPLLLPAGQGFEFEDVPPRDLASMIDNGQLMLPEPPADRMGELTAGEHPGEIVQADRWSPELASDLKILALPEGPNADINAARGRIEETLRRMTDASQRTKDYAEGMPEGAARDAILKRAKEYDKTISELATELADLEVQRQSREFTMKESTKTKLRKGQPEGQAVRDKDVKQPEVLEKQKRGKATPREDVVPTTKEEPAREEAAGQEPVVPTTEKELGDFLAEQAGMKYVGKAKGVHVFKRGRRTIKVDELSARALDEADTASRVGKKKAEPKPKKEEKVEPKKEKKKAKPKRKVGEKKKVEEIKTEPEKQLEKDKKKKAERKAETEKAKKKEYKQPEKAEEKTEIAAGTKKFVDRKVKELGSVEAVDALYTTKDAISEYARAKAREMFPEKGKVPKQEKAKKEETPKPEMGKLEVKVGKREVTEEEVIEEGKDADKGKKRNVGDSVLTPDGQGKITRVGKDRKNKDLREDQYEVEVDGEKSVYGADELNWGAIDKMRKGEGKGELADKVRKNEVKRQEEKKRKVGEKKEEKPKKRVTRDDKLAKRNADKEGLEYIGRDKNKKFVFTDGEYEFATDTPYTSDIRDMREATRPKTESEKLEETVGKTEKKEETKGVTRKVEDIEREIDQNRKDFGADPGRWTQAQKDKIDSLWKEYQKAMIEAQKESKEPIARAVEPEKAPEPTKEEVKRYRWQDAQRAAEDIAIDKGMASRSRTGNVYPRKGYTAKEISAFIARTRDAILAEQPRQIDSKVGKRVEFNYPQSDKYEHLAGQKGQGEIIKETKASYRVKTDDGLELLLNKKNVTVEPEARKGGAEKVREMTDEALAEEAERLGKIVESGEYVDPDYAKSVGREIMRRAQEETSKKRAKKDIIMETRTRELAEKNASKRFSKKTRGSIGDSTLSFMGTGQFVPIIRRTIGQLKRGFIRLNEARKALIGTFQYEPLPSNYFNTKRNMIMQKNRVLEFEVQFEMDSKKAIYELAKRGLSGVASKKEIKKDSKLLGEAMSLWIEYKDKPDLVQKYRDKVDEHTQRVIQRMENMSEAERDLARTLEMHIKETGVIGEHGGVLTMLRDNPLSGFISHIWESAMVQGDSGVKKFWQGSSKLGPKTQFGKERTFTEGFLEGIAAGYKPATLNVAELTRAYGESVWKAVTNKRFIDDLRKMSVDTDNRPAMVGIHEKGYDDYVAIDNYWLTKRKFTGLKDLNEHLTMRTYSGEELSRYLMEFVPVKVHPDIGSDLNNYLEPSWFTKSSKRLLLKRANYIAKKSLLSFTGFHHVAVGKTALFYMDMSHVVDALVRPWRISNEGLELISRQDADINLLLENGMTLSSGGAMDYGRQLASAMRDWDAYMRDSGVAKKVRGNLGKYSQWWDQALWDKFYRGSKALAGKIEYNRRLKKFERELTEGKISRQEIARRVARDMNNNFGGLNLEFGTGWMGEEHGRSRSKTAQDFTRFLLLAQDWTESNYKFFWQASAGSILKHGVPGRNFSVKEALFGDSTYYMAKVLFFTGVATNLINYAINGTLASDNDKRDKWSPYNTRIKVPIGGKSYYIDLFGHFMEPVKLVAESFKEGGNPLQKLSHKSSIPGRILLEQFTGRDWAGRHFATWEDVKSGKVVGSYYGGPPGLKETLPGRTIDVGRKFIPIPLNAVLGMALDDKSALEAVTTAVGLPMRERKRLRKTGTVRRKRRKLRRR